MSKRESILVSACLLGEACRYDGMSQPCESVISLARAYDLVPVCPEQLGGLPTPRTPSEIIPGAPRVGHKRPVKTNIGEDRTEAFHNGAQAALRIARSSNCAKAVLKSRSPSCGVHQIYDGTFSGTLVEGQGITAEALSRAGIEVLDENDVIARLSSRQG